MIKTAIFTTILAMVLASCGAMKKEDNVQTSSAMDQEIIDEEAQNDRETGLQ